MNAYEITKFMDERNVLLAFRGEFAHQLTTSLLDSIKTKLALEPTQFALNKKVYKVTVECIENISHHALQTAAFRDQSVFLFCHSNQKYIIITGNAISNERIDGLRKRLESTMNLNEEELRQLYKRQIVSVNRSEDGAGLGIIDIARYSSSKIMYNFTPMTREVSFYQFQTEINI
jgi:hypothetical protein